MCFFLPTVVSESEPSDAETLLSSSTDEYWEDVEEGPEAERISEDEAGSTDIKLEPASEDEQLPCASSSTSNATDRGVSPPPSRNGERVGSEEICELFETPERQHNTTYTVDTAYKHWQASKYKFATSREIVYLSDTATDERTKMVTQNNKPRRHADSLESGTETQSSCSIQDVPGKPLNVSRRGSDGLNATHLTLVSEDATLLVGSPSLSTRVADSKQITQPAPRHTVKDLLTFFSLTPPCAATSITDCRLDVGSKQPNSRPASALRIIRPDAPTQFQKPAYLSPNLKATTPTQCSAKEIPSATIRTPKKDSRAPTAWKLDQKAMPKASLINSACSRAPDMLKYKSTNLTVRCDDITLGKMEASNTEAMSRCSLLNIAARQNVCGVTSFGEVPPAYHQPDVWLNNASSLLTQVDGPSLCQLANSAPSSPVVARCKTSSPSQFGSWRQMTSVPAKPLHLARRHHSVKSLDASLADDECSDFDATPYSSPSMPARLLYKRHSAKKLFDPNVRAQVPAMKEPLNVDNRCASGRSPVSVDAHRLRKYTSHYTPNRNQAMGWKDNAWQHGNQRSPDTASTIQQCNRRSPDTASTIQRNRRSPDTASTIQRNRRSPDTVSTIQRNRRSPDTASTIQCNRRSPDTASTIQRNRRSPDTASTIQRNRRSPDTASTIQRNRRSPDTASTIQCNRRSPDTASTIQRNRRSPDTASTIQRNRRSPDAASTIQRNRRSPDTASTIQRNRRSPDAASTIQCNRRSPDAASTIQRNRRSPDSASTIQRNRRSPDAASTIQRNRRSPDTASTIQRDRRSPDTASTIQRNRRSPDTASTIQHNRRSPDAASTIQRNRRSPDTASTIQRNRRSPDTASTIQCNRRSPDAASTIQCNRRSPDTASTIQCNRRSPDAASTIQCNRRSPDTASTIQRNRRSPDAASTIQRNVEPPTPSCPPGSVTTLTSSFALPDKTAVLTNGKTAPNLGTSRPDRVSIFYDNTNRKSSTLPARLYGAKHGTPSASVICAEDKKGPPTDAGHGTNATLFQTIHRERAKHFLENCTPDQATSMRMARNVLTPDGTPTKLTPTSRRKFDSRTCSTPVPPDHLSRLNENSPHQTSPASSKFVARRHAGSPSVIFAKLKLQSPSTRSSNEHLDKDSTFAIPLLTEDTRPNGLIRTVRQIGIQSPDQLTYVATAAPGGPDAEPERHCKQSLPSKKERDVVSSNTTDRPLAVSKRQNDSAAWKRDMCLSDKSKPGVSPRRDNDYGFVGKRPTGHGRFVGSPSSRRSAGKHDDVTWTEESRSRKRLGFRNHKDNSERQLSNQQCVVRMTEDDLCGRTMVNARVLSRDKTVTEKECPLKQFTEKMARVESVVSQRKTRRVPVFRTSSPIDDGAVVGSESDAWSISCLSSIHYTAKVTVSSSGASRQRVPVIRQHPVNPISITSDSDRVSSSRGSTVIVLDSDNSDGSREDTFCTLVGSPVAQQRQPSKHGAPSAARSDSGFDAYELSEGGELETPMNSSRTKTATWRHESRVKKCTKGQPTKQNHALEKAADNGQKELTPLRRHAVEADTVRSRSCHVLISNLTNGRYTERGDTGRGSTRLKRARCDVADDTMRSYNSPAKRANVSLPSGRTNTPMRPHVKISKPSSVCKQRKVGIDVSSCLGPGRCKKPFCFACVTDVF